MIWKIIKMGMLRADIKSVEQLAQISGINPSTLAHARRTNPRSFRLFEIAQLDKVLQFTNEEWLQLREAI